MAEKKIQWLTLEESFERSRVPVSTLREKIRVGEIKAHKPGKAILIEADELERWIRKHPVGPQ